ncbi:MAG TPA: hypothetical protein DIS78_06120, partial [Lachnospiraceae bacterium]|nr:hypothetical protein [Lachnospiraceae bacterium]
MRKNDHRIAGKIAAVFLLTLFMTVLVLHFKVRADESLIAVRIYSNAPGGMTIPIECNDETMIAESRDSAGNGQFYRTGPDGKIGFKMSDDYYPQDLSRRDEGYFFAGWQVTGAESADEGCYENLSGDVRFTAQWIGTDIKDWTVSTYNGGCILTALAGATHREEVYIPKTINGLPVVEMMDLLKGSRKIKKLYLPEGIPLEPMISLEGCSALEQINTVDWQGEKIEIRDNRLPESIKTIEDGTFVGTGLVSLTLPEVTEVKCEQTGAFEGCRYLSTVSFCKAARIAGGTFGKITSWDHREKCSVTYPGSMSDLPWDAARYSPAVVFDCTDGYCGWCGDDYQEGRALYEGSCTHWKMDLSGNMIIESFGDEDDRDTLFRTHGEAQIIKKGQYDRSLIKTLKINHAYIISNRSFRGSTDLNRVEISPGMTKIGQEAFANCYELQSVKLPGSISELGMYSFADCKNSLYFEGTKAQWEKVNKTYLWCSSSLKIHVRCTVSFNAAGHGNAPASQTNLWSNEDKALDPGDLFADDHNFTGWYSDQACTAKWDFDDPVPGDMTLYAGWDPVTGPETIAAPTFDPAPGTYSEAVNVTISCSTQDADIYYTTNGTTPTDSSSKYTGPISVSETTTIKAIAVKSGMTNSEVATATYTISTAPTPHEHSYTSEVTTKPTCTEKGIRTYTCSCGDSYTEEIPALGHDYTSVITTQPTIFTEGVITYTCTRCDHSYTERVPKVDDGENKSDLIKDVTDDNGNTKAEVGTKTNEDGSTETTVTIGGQEVEKTATDANGNETVETSIWIGGLKSSYTYTGSAIEPSFHVYDGTKKLSSGKDYSVSFKNNKNAGATATITISFTGSYKGTEQEKLS